MRARGQNPGQADAGAALVWSDYVDGLVAEHGSLAAVASRVAALRAYREDVESVARALRRLRSRGTRAGGVWGDRLLAAFGLPASVGERLRFMGQYHSRFVDLPLPIATDLVQLWDRPPAQDSASGRRWLSLARATLALRAEALADAAEHLETAARAVTSDPVAAIELALGQAHLASRTSPDRPPAALAPIPGLLEEVRGADRDCLRARYTGQLAHALNRAGELDRALELHRALPDGAGTHPVARSRRANGLAYSLLRRADRAGALAEARRAATFAGDAGHVRLRAMALLMVSRIGGASDEAIEARQRAAAIAEALLDPRLAKLCRSAGRDAGGGAP